MKILNFFRNFSFSNPNQGVNGQHRKSQRQSSQTGSSSAKRGFRAPQPAEARSTNMPNFDKFDFYSVGGLITVGGTAWGLSEKIGRGNIEVAEKIGRGNIEVAEKIGRGNIDVAEEIGHLNTGLTVLKVQVESIETKVTKMETTLDELNLKFEKFEGSQEGQKPRV